jgi:hypothetical protein
MSQNKRRKPRTRAELLPLNREIVERMSLTNHLALSMLKTGATEAFQHRVIDEALFFTREFCRAGYGAARAGLLEDATEAHRRGTAAVDSGGFRADEAACALLGEIVALVDTQLERIPLHVLQAADRKLGVVTSSTYHDGRRRSA